MKLNHLNLCVSDVAETRAFFEKFFGFRCHEEKGANTLVILEDEAGFILALSNFQKTVQPEYPADFHIGFLLEDDERVREVYAQMQEASVAGLSKLQALRRGLTFYGNAPGSILFEVCCPL